MQIWPLIVSILAVHSAQCKVPTPCVLPQRSYVVYPPEGPRPPSAEEFAELRKQKQQERN